MGSSSHRKSDSSGRSTARKRVHLGTGTHSRTASAYPEAQVEGKGVTRQTDGQRDVRAHPGARRESQKRAQGSRCPEPETARVKREARERRRAEAQRARRLRLVVAVAIITAIVALSVGIYRSDLFTIRSVEVRGLETLTTDAILALASVPESSTLLRAPLDDIAARVEDSPWVASAVVSRRLPSTLVITVEERVPAALIDTGTEFWFVDAEGVVLGLSALETTGSVLPVIRDAPGLDPAAGQPLDSPAVENALAVLRGVSAELASIVRTVSSASVGETVLITESSIEIMVGEATRLEEKSALALSIMAEQAGTVVFIDVRSVERPISRGL